MDADDADEWGDEDCGDMASCEELGEMLLASGGWGCAINEGSSCMEGSVLSKFAEEWRDDDECGRLIV